jgi:hypothetical protein
MVGYQKKHYIPIHYSGPQGRVLCSTQMNRFVTALLLICVAVLGFIARLQSVALREQQMRVQELSAKLASNSTPSVSLELQEKCARQAREEFKHEGLEGKQMADFSNHYNPKLGKCFAEVEYTDVKTPGGIFVSRTVVDAFEGKVYGSYMWNNNTKKKYWEVPPLKCSVTMLSGEERQCHSDDGPEGFNALVKQYME